MILVVLWPSKNGIRVKYDAISVLGDGVTAIASEAESKLRFTFRKDIATAGVYLVSIPFESGGREFKHTIPFEVVDRIFEATPSRLYLRQASGYAVGKAVVKLRGQPLGNLQVSLFDDESVVRVLQEEMEFNVKSVTKSTAILEIRLRLNNEIGKPIDFSRYRLQVKSDEHAL